MRLSIGEYYSDSGFNFNLSLGSNQKVKILVDGVDVTNHCHTADEEEGKAYCYKCDEEGRHYIDPDNPHQAAQEVLEGKVEISFSRSPQDIP